MKRSESSASKRKRKPSPASKLYKEAFARAVQCRRFVREHKGRFLSYQWHLCHFDSRGKSYNLAIRLVDGVIRVYTLAPRDTRKLRAMIEAAGLPVASVRNANDSTRRRLLAAATMTPAPSTELPAFVAADGTKFQFEGDAATELALSITALDAPRPSPIDRYLSTTKAGGRQR